MTFKQSLWSLIPGRRGLSHTASELYGRLVAQAREPAFYARLGVPDTPEGRLELLVLHVVLVLRRLKREGDAGADLGRALAETFVADMDDCLREMGVGDISVAKKVKKAAAALYDRSKDYGRALDGADAAALARIVARHVFEMEGEPLPPAAQHIANYVLSGALVLEAASAADVNAGRFDFPALQH